MIKTDVLIVGGGPAGSACAWALRRQGVDCLVVDQREFPRFKPCAGWITPEVVRDLQPDIQSYPHGLTTYRHFEVVLNKVHFRLRTRQHAIRRVEFDDWLLKRSGAPVACHTVKSITRQDDGYALDGEYWGRYLVGSGGTHCPVARTFFEPLQPRDKAKFIVAMEDEFPYPVSDPRCWLWFFQDHLPGYAWYVPKANGYLNVGIGGMAESFKANGDSLKEHWKRLIARLDESGMVRGYDYHPSGHSYYLRQVRPTLRRENALLAGDAAGLATRDMGEGIGAAIRSGRLAAEAIINRTGYDLSPVRQYSIWSLLGFR